MSETEKKCSVVVAIPVYKENPSDDEILSLRRCVEVLGHYDICLVCPESLNTKAYDEQAGSEMQCRRFPDFYFKSIGGYNQLLKHPSFYKRFQMYEYVFIYQLDGWVFKDELTDWCRKGYDYVGAPWFQQYRNHEEGFELWAVGNGGVSLRRTEAMICITDSPRALLKTPIRVFREQYKGLRTLKHSIQMSLNLKKHRMETYLKDETLYEDVFFCTVLRGTRFQLRVPSPEEAARFSFESSPKYLYEEITKGQLPFACHAWKKYQYEEFWEKHISSLSVFRGL